MVIFSCLGFIFDLEYILTILCIGGSMFHDIFLRVLSFGLSTPMTTDSTKTPIMDGIVLGAQVIATGEALYALFGKENAPKVKEWAMNMEQEIVEKIDKVKNMTEPVLEKIIDEAKEKYEDMKDIDKDELKKMIEILRDHWLGVIKAK